MSTHPALGTLIRRGDPAYLVPTDVKTSERPRSRPVGPVTLVGDAAHPMPPAGLSAGVAIHDAGLLASRLVSATSILDAIRAYEADMFDYASAAVKASLRTHDGKF